MNNENLYINRLPAMTWNHMGMNGASVQNFEGVPYGEYSTDSADAEKLAVIKSINNAAVDELTASCSCDVYKNDGKPSVNKLTLADNNTAYNGVIAEENKTVTLFQNISSVESGKGALLTRLYAEKGAAVRLIQFVNAGSDYVLYNSICGHCEENASISVVQITVSGKGVYNNCETDLVGKRSNFEADLGYTVGNSDVLDINYVIRHTGKQTECRINAGGALRDNAEKTFRGTIDFIKGCSGSVGNETEDVLLVDENVINRTIPLILCAEEDVVGNHGAGIGQPDEEVLFYLASRGIDEKQAYAILERAKLDGAAMKIADDEIRKLVLDLIGGGNDDE